MKLLKKIRKVGESVLVVLGMVTIPFLPRAGVVALARFMGDAGRMFSPSLVRIARANLEVAFGESLTEAAKAAIVRQSYRTFALVLLDLFWFAVFSRRRVSRLVSFDESVRHYDASRPAIIVTGHVGNWEIGGQAHSLRGEPLVSVAMPLKNAVADLFLGQVRRRTGQKMARREGAIRAMLRALRSGGRVALLLDQNTLPEEGGIFVRLFGLDVPASKAPAMLARHTGAAMIISYCLPRPDGTYRVYHLPPYHLAGASELEATQAILLSLEGIIREHPGDWLWMYKRWKYVPAGGSSERYPFYARSMPLPG